MMHTLRGPTRRIAVIRVPHGRNNRLGRIGSISDYDWSQIPALAPLTAEPYMPAQPTSATGAPDTNPPTSAQWAAQIVMRQSDQRETTPGTLTYTPAPPPAPGTVARWNSWAGPCPPNSSGNSGAGSGSNNTAAATAAPGTMALNTPGIVYIAAILAGAASAAYLLNTLMGQRK